MLHLTSQSRIQLALAPVDFRKQIDGLVALCHNELKQQPRDGSLFVFINRSKTMIKVLYYDENGYWLAVKRLSRGRFQSWPNRKEQLTSIRAHELQKILQGLLASKDK